jgi:serine/threonine-protein kinase
VFGQLVVKLTTQAPPPLPSTSGEGARIPQGLKAVVFKCLEKDATRRPQSMAELSRMLEPFAAGEEGVADLPVVSRSKGPLVAFAAAAIAVLGLGGALVLRKDSSPNPAPPPVAAAAPAPVEPRTLESAEVRVKLSSNPAGARVVRLDSGAELGVTPLSRDLPRVDGPVSLRFTLPGHEPREEQVRLAQNVSLDVELTPLKAAAKPPKRGAVRRPVKKGGSRDAVIDPFAN